MRDGADRRRRASAGLRRRSRCGARVGRPDPRARQQSPRAGVRAGARAERARRAARARRRRRGHRATGAPGAHVRGPARRRRRPEARSSFARSRHATRDRSSRCVRRCTARCSTPWARTALLLGSEARGCRQRAAASATVTLADGRQLAADVVVGADGVGSAIRRRLHPDEPPPRASGYHALRGVTHDAARPSRRRRASASIWATASRPDSRAPARPPSTGTCRLVSTYVAGRRDAGRVLERCLRGLDAARSASIARAARPRGSAARADCSGETRSTTWGSGRVTLLGDAAHPVLPHTAQGAALALEDAVALGLALARGGDAPRRAARATSGPGDAGRGRSSARARASPR